MELEDVKKVRSRLHNLISDRNISLPLQIDLGDGVHLYDEMMSCFCWDDNEGVVYIVSSNTVPTATNDGRLFPMEITAIPYESIMTISIKADRNVLDHFFDYAVKTGISDEKTRKHYFNEITSLYDPETYLMGNESPSTEKTPDPYVNRKNRDLQFKDQPIDPNALHTL